MHDVREHLSIIVPSKTGLFRALGSTLYQVRDTLEYIVFYLVYGGKGAGERESGRKQ